MIFLLTVIESFAAVASEISRIQSPPELAGSEAANFCDNLGCASSLDRLLLGSAAAHFFAGSERVVTHPRLLFMPVDMKDAPLFLPTGWV